MYLLILGSDDLVLRRMMTNKFRCQGVATKNQINMALILDTQKM